MKVSVNWLKDFVTLAPPFETLAEELTLAGLEVKKVEPLPESKDHLFEMEITSNRPDWLSHLGVAREIAAVRNIPLKLPPLEKPVNRPAAPGWQVHLKEIDGCPYYTGVYMEGIPNAPTPDFIKERLSACGIRSIHILVDITNYVLLETGQPLHAFDADLLKGQEIQVRRARQDEKFIAINGEIMTLSLKDLVIADKERVIALAGVMGGKETEVSDRTRNIFLESAFFHPRWVRHTSRDTGISTDSSYRFERRVDPESVDFGRDRAVALIQQYAKPRFMSAVLKAGQKPLPPKSVIHLSTAEVEKKLGCSIKSHQISSILTRLGFETKADGKESWKVEIPSFRSDVTLPIDLIEEVARIFGYENIPETLPARPPLSAAANRISRLENELRSNLVGAGFYETITMSVIPAVGLKDDDLNTMVHVPNPQNQDLCWMRPFFWPSFLSVIQKNASWGAESTPIFEMANLYRKDFTENSQVLENRWIGAALAGRFRPKNWLDTERDYNFYDVKGLVENLLQIAGIKGYSFRPLERSFFVSPCAEEVIVAGTSAGYFGELNPKLLNLWDLKEAVFYAQLSLEILLKNQPGRIKVEDLPRYPSMRRDISIVVPESAAAGSIEKDILMMGQGLIVRVEVFDFFRGGRIPKGFKNLAIRVIYQSKEKTLIAEEVQKLHFEIADAIVKKHGASFQ